jgi:lysophospholipase L1-like esterase
MKRLLAAVFILACTVLVAESVLLGVRLYRGVKLAGTAKAFSCKPFVVKHRVLVVGDATAAGVGAEDPSGSISGRISREFPLTEVRNLARPGASASDVLGQVSSAAGGFDLVLVQAGAEDVIRLRDLDAAQAEYSRVLHAASRLSPRVVFLGIADVGRAPAFFPPVSWMYSRRAARLRDLLVLACRETGVEYADLFSQGRDDPRLGNARTCFAADGLHPSGDGYALWYGELKRQTALLEALRGN